MHLLFWEDTSLQWPTKGLPWFSLLPVFTTSPRVTVQRGFYSRRACNLWRSEASDYTVTRSNSSILQRDRAVLLELWDQGCSLTEPLSGNGFLHFLILSAFQQVNMNAGSINFFICDYSRCIFYLCPVVFFLCSDSCSNLEATLTNFLHKLFSCYSIFRHGKFMKRIFRMSGMSVSKWFTAWDSNHSYQE